jgi:hypothetical protein
MRLFIRYSATGEILSASKTEIMDQSLAHPFGGIEDAESVLEVEPTDELKALFCHEICEEYTVDTKKPALQKKAGGKKR